MKLLFDECLSPHYCELLARFVARLPHAPICSHLNDHGWRSEPDEVWVPRVKSAGWIVVTGDMGLDKKKIPIQPLLRKNLVTGICLWRKLNSKSGFEKSRSVIVAWHRIVATVASATAGTQFKIIMEQDVYRLEVWREPRHRPANAGRFPESFVFPDPPEPAP